MRIPFPADLGPRYVYRQLLGEGAVGTVFLAEDSVVGRDVAIKVLSGKISPVSRSRFQREAKLMAEVRHSHLVEIYDVGALPEGPYLVMERLEGASLDRLADGPDLISMSREIGEALDHLHGRGIVHRDVKPGNIFRARAGRFVLTDLGMAFDPATTRVTYKDSVVGTLVFLSPETLQGKDVSPSIDWWALGVTLFFLAEGRPPFPVDRILGTIEGKALPPLEFEKLPAKSRIHALIEGLLAPELEARIRSFEAVRVLLERPRSPQPQPFPSGPLPPAANELESDRLETSLEGSPIRRGGLGASAVPVALLLGVVLLLGALAFGDRPAPAPVIVTPPPALGASPLGVGFTQRVREQYFALESATVGAGAQVHLSGSSPELGEPSLLTVDPAHWGLVMTHSPALREALDAQAGGLESFPAQLEDLKNVDEFFEGQGLDPPFLAVRSTRPLLEPVALSPEWNAKFKARLFPQPPAGWLGRAVRAVLELQVAKRRLEMQVSGDLSTDPAPPAEFFSRPFLGFRVERLLGHARAHKGLRGRAHNWVRSEVDEYRRLLFALAQAVDEGGAPGKRALISLFVLLKETDWLRPTPLALAPVEFLLSGPARTPARRLLGATVQERLLHVRRDVLGLDPRLQSEQLLEQLAEIRTTLARSEGESLVKQLSWVVTLNVHLGTGRSDLLLDCARRIRPPPWEWADASVGRDVLKPMGLALERLRDSHAPTEEERAGVALLLVRMSEERVVGRQLLIRTFGVTESDLAAAKAARPAPAALEAP